MPFVGGRLFAVTSGIEDLNGLPDSPVFGYQWQWFDDVSGLWVNVSGGTGEFYEVTSVDVGRLVRVRVNFTDRGRYEEVLFSVSWRVLEGGFPGELVWSGLLTVGENSSASQLGFGSERSGVIFSGGGLSDENFSFNGVEHNIPAIYMVDGLLVDKLVFEVWPLMDERGWLGLKLATNVLEFSFLDAYFDLYQNFVGENVQYFEWNSSMVEELGWELGDQVFLVLRRDPVVLVGNVEGSVSSSVDFEVDDDSFVAQRFSTGSYSGGYRVSKVVLRVNNGGSGSCKPVIGIYSEGNGLPGVLLGEFRIVRYNGLARFTFNDFFPSGSGGVVLKPSADYFVRVSGEGCGSNSLELSLGDLNDVGFGGVPGWSINSSSRFSSSDGGLNWSAASRRSLRFNLTGGVNVGGYVKEVNVNELSSSRVVVNVSVGNSDEVGTMFICVIENLEVFLGAARSSGVVSSESVQFSLTGLESNVSYEVEVSLNEGFF